MDRICACGVPTVVICRAVTYGAVLSSCLCVQVVAERWYTQYRPFTAWHAWERDKLRTQYEWDCVDVGRKSHASTSSGSCISAISDLYWVVKAAEELDAEHILCLLSSCCGGTLVSEDQQSRELWTHRS